jgi:hypothetical protein
MEPPVAQFGFQPSSTLKTCPKLTKSAVAHPSCCCGRDLFPVGVRGPGCLVMANRISIKGKNASETCEKCHKYLK